MAKADAGKLAKSALVKLGAGLVGNIPVAGAVLKAIVDTGLEAIVASRPSDAQVTAKLAQFAAEGTARDVATIKQAHPSSRRQESSTVSPDCGPLIPYCP